MFCIDAGGTRRYCDGLNRRSFVQLGIAGMATCGLADVLRAQAESGAADPTAKKETSAILIWLDGGPSHLDLYDLKPEAPAEFRGIWRPIHTNVAGFEISELFPKQAQVADKFSIVRSLAHSTGDHFAGAHRMLTGQALGVSGANREGKFPSVGAIVSRQRGPRHSGMPAYVSVPVASSVGRRPGYFGGKWLGAEFDPFQTGGDPSRKDFKVKNLDLASGLSIARLEDRRGLAAELDRFSRAIDTSGRFETMDRYDAEAFDFVTGQRARNAFDIGREEDKVRDGYGRNNWGQSVLLARRLVEAGTRFVTVHFGGWDHHWNLKAGMERHLPRVDTAVAALLADLDQRGLWESTLVILCGEFSRTPRMNDGRGSGTPGRDHWGNAMFCLLGGGGVRGGQIVGETDDKGQYPIRRPVRPHHIHATIHHALGIDPKLRLVDLRGRPTRVLEDPTPIAELI